MYPVSAAYRHAMRRQVRDQGYVQLQFGHPLMASGTGGRCGNGTAGHMVLGRFGAGWRRKPGAA